MLLSLCFLIFFSVLPALAAASGPDPDAAVNDETFGNISSEPPVQRAVLDTAKPAQGEGQRVGSFIVYPDLTVAESYNDNIFATLNERKSDFITVFAPTVRAESDWKQHELRFQGSAQLDYYHDHDTENYQDYNFESEGRYDLAEGGDVYGGVWFGRDHEDRESPDNIFGATPVEYYDFRTYAGVFRRFGRMSVRIGGRFEKLNYLDVRCEGGCQGEINNDDRDRTVVTGGVRVGFQLTSHVEPYVQAAVDRRDYRSALDNNGFHRDSDGYRLLAGVEIELMPAVRGEGFAGYLRQDYADRVLPNVERPAFGGLLTWSVSPATAAYFFLDRTVEETTISGASAMLYTGGGVRVSHDFTERLSGAVGATYSVDSFVGTVRNDKVTGAEGTLEYELTEYLTVQTEYTFERMVSNVDFEGYRDNRILIGIETRF